MKHVVVGYLVKGSSGTSLHGGVDQALAGPVDGLQIFQIQIAD